MDTAPPISINQNISSNAVSGGLAMCPAIRRLGNTPEFDSIGRAAAGKEGLRAYLFYYARRGLLAALHLPGRRPSPSRGAFGRRPAKLSLGCTNNPPVAGGGRNGITCSDYPLRYLCPQAVPRG